MFIYIFFFFLLSFMALRNKQYLTLTNSLFLGILISIFVGLKYYIGPDFINYLTYSQNMIGSEFRFSLGFESFEQQLLWLSSNLGFSVYGYYFVIASIFSIGLLHFVSREKNTWLSLLVAYPYLIIAVAMGYPGQSAAIGCEFIALYYFEKNKLMEFYLMVLIATFFHSSAIGLTIVPLFNLVFKLNKKSSIRVLLVLIPVIYFIFFRNFSEIFINYSNFYFAREYNARGILVKILITLSYALFFILFRKKYDFDIQNNKILKTFSYLSIFSLILYFFVPSTTALYRMSLYLIPLQLKMASIIPPAQLFRITDLAWKTIIITLNFLTLIIFLLFSTHSQTWVPYRNLLFL